MTSASWVSSERCRRALWPPAGGASPRTLVAALESHDRPHLLPARDHRDLGARHAQDRRLMREAGLERPTVTVRAGAVVVTFALPEEAPASPAAPPETPQKTDETPQKTPRRGSQEAILDLLKKQPRLTLSQVASVLGNSESAVKRAARKLRKSGRLVRIGPDKGGHWKVIDAETP